MDIAALIAALLGGGLLGGAITHQWQWQVEKKRDLRSRHKELIAMGRALVAEARREGWNAAQTCADPRFDELRPHLSAKTLEGLKHAHPRTAFVAPDPLRLFHADLSALQADLDRLE